MLCKHCHAEIGDNEKFCRFCGKAQQKLCPQCGTQLSDTAKFCNACGKQLEAPKAPAQKKEKPVREKKKRPWGLIAIIAVLCVALIVGGFFAVKTFTEFRDRQQDLENQLADRDREDKKDKDKHDKDDDRVETDPEPEPDPEPAPDKPAPDAPAVNETPAEIPEAPTVEEVPALPYRPKEARPAVDFEEFYVGLVLAGRKVYGMSADIYTGLADSLAELGFDESHIWYVEDFFFPEETYFVCRELADAGCSMVIVASNLYPEYEVMLAEEYPDTMFLVLGGTAAAVSGLPNLTNAWPRTHEMWYVAGAIAGMQLLLDLEAGNVEAPFAAFFVNEFTTEAISDYSAFYLGMRSVMPDAILFAFQHWNNPDAARDMAYEAAYGIGCSILVDHKPNGGNVIPNVAMEVCENGFVCHAFAGNMDPIRLHEEVGGVSIDLHWNLLLQPMLSNCLYGDPMPADFTVGVTEDAFVWNFGSSLNIAAEEGMVYGITHILAGEPVFDTASFTCWGSYDDSAVLDNSGRVKALYVYDTDFDGVEDGGNAVDGGVIWEGELRSAPVFDLQIDGIEVVN